jgi:hypothetical protein
MKPSNQTPPYSNVNGAYVNKFNTNWPGFFSSKATGKEFGLPEPINKDQAAIPYIKGMGMLWGGRGGEGGRKKNRSIRNKKYNIRKYKMKRTRGRRRTGGIRGLSSTDPVEIGSTGGKRRTRGRRRTGGIRGFLDSTGGKRRTKGRGRRLSRTRTRRQAGGTYNQWQGNIPNTPTFSTGGVISAKNLGLANPVPYQKISNCTNCVDNYNHNTNKGFQFW